MRDAHVVAERIYREKFPDATYQAFCRTGSPDCLEADLDAPVELLGSAGKIQLETAASREVNVAWVNDTLASFIAVGRAG